MAETVLRGHASLEDARVYYEVYGAGAPVFLLHGNGEDLHVFDAMTAALSRQYQVFALDTRGHGKSTRGKKPFHFKTFAEDVAGVMECLKIPQALVVGFSDGGNTALHLALQFPERVSGLVLLGANLTPKGLLPRYRLPTRFSHMVCSVIARVDKRARHNKEQLELMVKHPSLTPEQLHGIKVPALVMAGELDMIRPEHTAAIAASLPQGQLKILPGTDHFQLPRAEQALQSILDFLAETEAPE